MLSVPLFRGPVLYFFQYRAALRQMRNEEKELLGKILRAAKTAGFVLRRCGRSKKEAAKKRTQIWPRILLLEN